MNTSPFPASFSILTDANPAADRFVGPTVTLEAVLKARGLPYTKVEGSYSGQSEPAYLVPNIEQRTAADLARAFWQESVLHVTGAACDKCSVNVLEYVSGPNFGKWVVGRGYRHAVIGVDSAYTFINGVAWTFDLDFSSVER